MAAERWRVLCASIFLPLVLCAQPPRPQPILERTVDVHANNVRLSEGLRLIAHDAGFKLSYNAALFNGDSMVMVNATGTVKDAMRGLIGRKLLMKESGEHLILLAEGTGKNKFTAQGSVVDRTTRLPIPHTSVYEVKEKNAATTDANGAFTVELSGQRDPTALLVSRSGYRDTVLFVGRDGRVGQVMLSAMEHLDRIDPLCRFDRCDVEDLGVARLLVGRERIDQAANLITVERSKFQASILPSIGTNGKIGGAVVNTYSFNLFGGYARGLDGFELGGGFNMEREDVKGMQVAGIANLVGGHTNGVQIAGGFNHTMRSLKGVQIAGMSNTVWDTLSGAQIAGGVNVVKGRMTGTQVSGAVNVTTQDMDGAQIAGAINVTVKDVNKTQVAGVLNYGRNVEGAQVAGVCNAVFRSVGGGQAAGVMNVARDVTGGQVAGVLNVAIDTVRGGQVGLVNFGRVVVGGQVGLINFSDTIAGGSIGLLSIARRGYHRFDVITGDVMTLSLQFRTGTRAFHNILGYSPAVTPDERWGFLYGLGTEPRLGKHGALAIDLTGEQVVEQREWVPAVNIVGRFGVSYVHTFGKHLTLSAGPVLNTLFSDWRYDEIQTYRSALPPADPLFRETEGDVQITGWLGWRASVGVRF